MERVALQIDAPHLRLGDFASDGVFAAVQSASDLQSLRAMESEARARSPREA